MSFLKKTIFWIIILIILGGGFYLIDRRVEDVKRSKEASMRLFPFEPQDVAGFWIRNGKERILITRKDGDWWVEEPLKAKGDKEVIEALLRNVVKAKKDAVLFKDPEPVKLKELGLESPQLEIGFKVDNKTLTLLFGDKAPAHNVAYAMFKGNSEVYRIHSDVKEEADKSIYDLRDKTILSFDPLMVKRFEIEFKGKNRIVIEQPIEGKWDIIAPVKGQADMRRVLETLYKLKNSKVKAFIEEEPSQLDKYNLLSPNIKVSILEKKDRSERHTLLIGGRDRTQRGYFAKRGNSGNVFLVEEELFNSLLLDINEWKKG